MSSPLQIVPQSFDITGVRSYLENMGKLRVRCDAANGTTPRLWAGPEAFVLHYGREMAPAPLPKRIKRAQPRACYYNAYMLAVRGRGRYTYCEGVGAGFIATEHAWCVDRKTGLVVDPTWEVSHGYFGVEFRLDYVRGIVAATRQYSMIQNMPKYPLLTGEHPPEMWQQEAR